MEILNFDPNTANEILDKIKGVEHTLYCVSDFFEVSNGLLESRFHSNRMQKSSDGEINVKFIRASSIHHNEEDWDDATIDLNKVLNYPSGYSDNPNDKKIGKKTETIPEYFLLKAGDFLINTKGIPKLIRCTESLFENNINLVATHHFHILKPRKNLDVFLEKLKINKTYLEFILNNSIKSLQTLAEKAEKLYEKSKLKAESENDTSAFKKRKSASTAIPAILKNEIESLELFIPKSLDKQNVFEEEMKKLKSEMKKLDLEIKTWQKELFEISSKNSELTLHQIKYFLEKK